MSRNKSLTALILAAGKELKARSGGHKPFLSDKRVYELSDAEQPAPSGVSPDYLRLLKAVRHDESLAMSHAPIADQVFRLVESEINATLTDALLLEEELLSVVQGI